jgi:hypothetical protein
MVSLTITIQAAFTTTGLICLYCTNVIEVFFTMSFLDKLMIAFIVALIITCLFFGPRIISLAFTILLAATLSMKWDDRRRMR